MNVFLADGLDQLDQAENEMLDAQDGIEDVFDTYDDRIEAINKAVVNKAIKQGMASHHVDKF